MKQCPDCSTRNQATNIFCPTCGHSFLDDTQPEPRGNDKLRNIIPGHDNRRLAIIITIVVILVLGLAAGLTSYFVSREIDRSSLVMVRSGILWKCAKCGKLYKDRVTSLSVKKSEKADYGVETVEGLCDRCKYGELVGSYQDALEYMAKNGYFHAYGMDISAGAAAFMSANPTLFPAADQGSLAAIAQQVDPRILERDFAAHAGKPVAMTAVVQLCQAVKMPDGRILTYLRLQPLWEKAPLNVEILAVYGGSTQVSRGETVSCYMLPADVVAYRSDHGDRNAVLGIVMALNPV
ncbi:MAG: hypothetical protein ACYC99_03290 [Candidatus Geothermincolia bacterium]